MKFIYLAERQDIVDARLDLMRVLLVDSYAPSEASYEIENYRLASWTQTKLHILHLDCYFGAIAQSGY
jgi:hypothetical protein